MSGKNKLVYISNDDELVNLINSQGFDILKITMERFFNKSLENEDKFEITYRAQLDRAIKRFDHGFIYYSTNENDEDVLKGFVLITASQFYIEMSIDLIGGINQEIYEKMLNKAVLFCSGKQMLKVSVCIENYPNLIETYNDFDFLEDSRILDNKKVRCIKMSRLVEYY